jgi:FAD/FMN-containing dehydrogenase
LGDGTLHFNAFPPAGEARDNWRGIAGDVKSAVHDLVHDYQGSVSAEHGIGRLKTGDLERYGDPVKLAVMRQIKDTLDPRGILNPGAVLALTP